MRARTAAAAAATTLLALAGSGCETTAERSTKLERAAHHSHLAEHGVSVSKPSPYVHVIAASVVRGSEGAAVAITMRNDSGRTLTDVPIEIAVKDARGVALYRNTTPGLEAGLTSLASLPAHGEETWVNDQVQAAGGAPASVSALVGEAPAAIAPLPQLEVSGVHESEEAGTIDAAGTVRNRSRVAQEKLVVYVLARRAGRIVAAGRAVLPEVAAGAAVPFQAFLQGSPAGARLEASAPASTFG